MKKNGSVMIVCVILGMLFSQTAFAASIYPVEGGGLQGFDLLAKGAEREVEFASTMCVGDFNGDNIMDLAVGSPKSNSPRGIEAAGTVSIFFGGPSFTSLPTTFEAIEDNQESVLLYGGDTNEYAGEFLASGDVNHDGIDDLVIAAQRVLDTGMPVSPEDSKIYVVYGGSTLSGNVALSTSSDVTIQRSDSMHVENITVADVNNDGTDDILISDILTDSTTNPPVAPLVDGSPRQLNGAVYIIYGGNLGQAIDPSQDSDATILRDGGSDVLQVYGISVGDFNGDNKNDIALGAPGEDGTSSSLSDTGRVYLIMGGQTLDGNIEVATSADLEIIGGLVNDQIGTKMEACDFNNDGIDDVIIGAPLSGWGESGTTGKGKVQVVFGSASLGSSSILDLFDSADVTLQLSEEFARIGFKTGLEILTTDVNGDGIDDLTISSPNAFVASGTNGWVHVVYGRIDPMNNYDLNADADISVIAPESTTSDPLSAGRMGETMAAADLNNDGNMDLLLGAPGGTGNDSYVESGWFGVIFDPANYSSAQSCITINANRSFFLPYLKYGDMSFGIGFNHAGGLDFILDLATYAAADTTATMIELSPDLSIEVPCADVFGTSYEFTLVPDALYSKWSLDLNTIEAN